MVGERLSDEVAHAQTQHFCSDVDRRKGSERDDSGARRRVPEMVEADFRTCPSGMSLKLHFGQWRGLLPAVVAPPAPVAPPASPPPPVGLPLPPPSAPTEPHAVARRRREQKGRPTFTNSTNSDRCFAVQCFRMSASCRPRDRVATCGPSSGCSAQALSATVRYERDEHGVAGGPVRAGDRRRH